MSEEKFYVEEGSSTTGKAVNENKKQVLLIGSRWAWKGRGRPAS